MSEALTSIRLDRRIIGRDDREASSGARKDPPIACAARLVDRVS